MSLLPHEAVEEVRQAANILQRGLDRAHAMVDASLCVYPAAFMELDATGSGALAKLTNAIKYLPEAKEHA